jgi:hypothetical protein
MKRILILFSILVSQGFYSQTDLFKSLKERIMVEHPEIKQENKLIVVNVWSAGNAASREASRQLDKASVAYEWAKLKGGPKGMTGIVICADDDETMEKVVMDKDKLKKAISIKKDGLDLKGISNIIFDHDGNVLAKNVNGDIFEEVHKLITR